MDVPANSRSLDEEAFFERVQNPATRSPDAGYQVEESRKALLAEGAASTFVRSAAACVLSYRYLEGNASALELLPELCRALEAIRADLRSSEVQDGHWMRWSTSVRMAHGYVALEMEEFGTAREAFGSVSDSAGDLHLWPQMTSSLIAACLFGGCLEQKLGNRGAGLLLFDKAPGIFRTGANLLELDKYWPAREMSSAVSFLSETNNEKEYVLTGVLNHPRGNHLWETLKALFDRKFLGYFA